MNRLRRHQVKIMPATVLDHRFFPFTYYKGSFAFAFQKNVTTRFRRVGKGGFRQLLVALNRKSAAIVSFKFKHNKIPLAWAGGYKGSGRFLEENSPAVSLCMPISASNAVVYELDRFRLRGKVERFQFQRREQRRCRPAALRAADPFGLAYHEDISRPEHLCDGLIESKIL